MSGSWSPTDFPNLTPQNHQIKSEETRNYNCLAWAAGEADRRWEPDIMEQWYWPDGVERDQTIKAFVKAYMTLGYERCPDGRLEPGFEKIAIYAFEDGTATHAARQLSSGVWTSKLGDFEDIDHETLDCLIGPQYGKPVAYLRRKSLIV